MIARRVTLMPHGKRGGGKRNSQFRFEQSIRERFRKWALIYWPEALK